MMKHSRITIGDFQTQWGIFRHLFLAGIVLCVGLRGSPAQAAELCQGLVATIVGTSGNDTINGTAGPDIIVGLGGNDKIKGNGGDDVICGGDGKDKIYGGDGNDILEGGDGNDKVYGNAGNDVLAGGAGGDTLRGDAGMTV